MKCCRRFRRHRSPTHEIEAAVAPLRGEIDQIPSAVSAIKVDGKRAYQLAREGQTVELAARRVRIDRFDVARGPARPGDLVDVDVEVDCSSGTYIRALARDVGAALGVGGHLTALRRTRVGRFGLDEAHTLEELAERAAAQLLARRGLPAGVSAPRPDRRGGRVDAGHGRALAPAGIDGRLRRDRPGRSGDRAAAGRRAAHEVRRRDPAGDAVVRPSVCSDPDGDHA